MVYRIPWRRHLLLIAAIVFALGLMAGCGRDKNDEATAADESAVAPEPAEEAVAEEAAVEEAAVLDSSTVQGVCNHPYYPIRDGAVYHYRITSEGSDPVEMSTTYKVTGPDTFVTVNSFDGISDMSTELSWRCTDEGLLNTDFGMSDMDMPGMEYSMENVSGTTVPLPDKLQTGSEWQSLFSMSGSMAEEGMEIQMNIDAVMDNVMVGFEEVTVPAGTYKAAKIETMTTVDMKMNMGDAGTMAMPGMEAMSMGSAMWLVDGVGMVKSMTGDEEWSTVTELVSIE